MKITSIVEITKGNLLNNPFISSINNFQIDPKKAINGTLFFAINKKDIKEAVDNGAYCIIFEGDIDIIDEEIAWISVDNLENAFLRIFRYYLEYLNVEGYFCDNITIEIIKLHKNINIIDKNIFNNINLLNTKIDYIFCSDINLIKQIYPKYIKFEKFNFDIKNLIEYSLFEISFEYKDIFYNKIKYSKLYLNNLLSVIDFLGGIDISKLKNINIFKPIFIDDNLYIKDFGKSNKFIILSLNNNTKIEFETIKEKYKYAKIIYLEKNNHFNFLDELKSLLKTNFNIAYINNLSLEELYKILQIKKEQKSLF